MKTYELYSGKRGNGSRERSADDIERDLGNIRSEMSSTLRAIESKLSGGDFVGQIVNQLRGGSADSGELLRNLSSVARANPIPVALIATGIGAMVFSGSEGTAGMTARARQRAKERVERYRTEHAASPGYAEDEGPGLGERARGVKEGAQERIRDVKEGAGQRLHGVQERAKETTGRAREKVQHGTERARENLRYGSERAREGARIAQQQGRRLAEEEPLVLAGLGLALGAAIAASMPLVRESRDRYRREKIESELRDQRRQAEQQEPLAEEISFVAEDKGTIAWQEEPRVVEPEIRRPEFPEDDTTPYR